jgi:hypothetical protein
MRQLAKNLISDAFGGQEEGEVKEDLRKLEFGDRNILLEKGNHFFLAVVFTGRANKDLVSRIKSVIKEIEDTYTDELVGWEGYTDAFEGIDEIIASLLPQVKIEKEEEEIKELTVEVPAIEEYYGDVDEIGKEPEYEEIYEEEAVEVPKELEEEVIIKAPEDLEEGELFIEEFIEPEKKVTEDELDEALKDYIDETVGDESKATFLPPPSPLKTTTEEETGKKIKMEAPPPPSGLDRDFKRKGVLSKAEKEALPPPPWLRDKAPPDIHKSPKPEVEEEPIIIPPPIIPEAEEAKTKIPPLAPPPKPQVIEEVIEEVVYEYECPSCGAGVSEDMSKCPSCGTEFRFEEEGEEVVEEVEEEVEEEIEEYECPSCGASVTPDMAKCPNCGVHFAS